MAEVGILSPSKLLAYLHCSKQYDFNYVKHEKVPEGIAFIFGKSIHYFVDNFYDKNFKSDTSFANSWNFYWRRVYSGENLKGKQKENLKVSDYFSEDGKVVRVGNHINIWGMDPINTFFGRLSSGRAMLKKFYNRHIIEKKENDSGREPPFLREWRFGNKKDQRFKIKGHFLSGRIDRGDRINGKVFLIDYKTDKKLPKDRVFDVLKSLQFTIYDLAFEDFFSEKAKAMVYYNLKEGKTIQVPLSKQHYDYLYSILDFVSNGISKDLFFRRANPREDYLCGYCDFKNLCIKSLDEGEGNLESDLEKSIRESKEFEEWGEDFLNWMGDV
jgi:CRISPR/Cas system-associated exonuclease Cas4 (RecB family)